MRSNGFKRRFEDWQVALMIFEMETRCPTNGARIFVKNKHTTGASQQLSPRRRQQFEKNGVRGKLAAYLTGGAKKRPGDPAIRRLKKEMKDGRYVDSRSVRGE